MRQRAEKAGQATARTVQRKVSERSKPENRRRPIRAAVPGCEQPMVLHRTTGQGVVNLKGPDGKRRQVYCGRFFEDDEKTVSAKALQRAAQVIRDAELLGGAAPVRKRTLTMRELRDRFLVTAEQEHSRSELAHLRLCLGFLLEVVGGTLPAAELGPLRLARFREAALARGTWNRATINANIRRVRQVVAWAVSVEELDAAQLVALNTVKGIRAGKGAREPRKVQPVAWDDVAKVLPHLSAPVAALVMIAWYSGSRMGELVGLCPRDIDRSGAVWTAKLERHKTAHRGHERVLRFGPAAQSVLEPFLTRFPDRPLFSPREAEDARLAALGASRTARERRVGSVHACYSTGSVRLAVQRACRRAGVPTWHPHMLRHSFAQRARELEGAEAVQASLGHKTVDMVTRYSQASGALADSVAARIG